MNLRRQRWTPRSGMTIMEVMVVLAIGVLLLGILVPSLASIFMLNQRTAARELTTLYQQLHDEAVMRNVTFRLVFNLRASTYEVQVGDPRALIHTNAQEREDFEAMLERRLELMGDEERQQFLAKRKVFSTLNARFKTKFELPSGTVFGGVYTPQYPEMVRPSDLDDDDDGLVYSYIFANGQSEHAVVWMVTEGDEEDGFTIEVEPLSGTVTMHAELIDWEDSFDFVPREAPDLPDN